MILGYLIRKINILLCVFIITGCSTINNNISNVYEDIFVKEQVSCPLISTAEGSGELIAVSETSNNNSYVGFRGIKKICYLNDSTIKMNLSVNLRSIRNNFKNDDLIKLKISLVSLTNNGEEFDRDDFKLGLFLKSGSQIVERKTDMSIVIPKDGKVYIGIIQN